MTPTMAQPNQRKHPDGVHRDQHTRPIYLIPADHNVQTKCGWNDETGRHGCNAQVPGGPYQRMTTFIGVLEDTFRLEKWGKRNVAIGFAMADHLVLKVSGEIDPDDPHANKTAIDAIVEEAEVHAKAAAGADSGSALHNLTEKLDRGHKAMVPKANKPDIDAYQKMLVDRDLTVDEIEVAVVIDGVSTTKTSYGIGGKFDRIVGKWIDPVSPWPCPTCGARRRVLDLKTQKTMEWGPGKTAMQLAGYARAMRYNPATGERTDLLVCQCYGYVLHLPVGKGEATLHRADLGRARSLLRVAYDVWQARAQTGLLAVVTDQAPDVATSTPAPPPEGNGQLDVHGLIGVAADRDSLVAIWTQAKAAGQWALGHELAAKKRLAELEEAKTS